MRFELKKHEIGLTVVTPTVRKLTGLNAVAEDDDSPLFPTLRGSGSARLLPTSESRVEDTQKVTGWGTSGW